MVKKLAISEYGRGGRQMERLLRLHRWSLSYVHSVVVAFGRTEAIHVIHSNQ